MKFSAREDIEAPIPFIFEQMTDHVSFERAALRRGAKVRRTDREAGFVTGASWDITFRLRGKPREISATVTSVEQDGGYAIGFTSKLFEGVAEVELVPLSRSRSRIIVGFDVRPRTLSARLMLQSVKLGKSALDKRFAKRLSDFAKEIELRQSAA